MSTKVKYRNAIYALIEAAHTVSAVTNVPVETLIMAMLSVVKREQAEAMLNQGQFFAPLHLRPAEGESLVPTSARYEHMLGLIERDNPELHRKLTGLD